MQKTGGAPTVREICQGVGLASPSTVLVHQYNMETAGRSGAITPSGAPSPLYHGESRIQPAAARSARR